MNFSFQLLYSSPLFGCFLLFSNCFLKSSSFCSVYPFSSQILWLSLQSFWTLSWVDCLSLHHLFSWGFILFLCLKHSSVASFCLRFYLYFFVCGRLVTFPDSGEVALCRRYPMHPRSALPSRHPRNRGHLFYGSVWHAFADLVFIFLQKFVSITIVFNSQFYFQI